MMIREFTTSASLLVTLGFFSGQLSAAENTNDSAMAAARLSYPVVDTNQMQCTGVMDALPSCPSPWGATYGQDSQYQGFTPSYTTNQDRTVRDNVTRLTWSQTPDIDGDGKIDAGDKLTYDQALVYAQDLRLGGYDDWRIPTIKELYSLIMFDGQDPSGLNPDLHEVSLIPFIDTAHFGFGAGDTQAGERLIDSQFVSSTKYVSTTMRGNETVFGVNFIDGRIKGYGITMPGNRSKDFYVLAVRGNQDYGSNRLIANDDGTVTDEATGLTWQQDDSQEAMDFPTALEYCEDLELATRDRWRLPNAKELQSIVDYERSPATTHSAAIDALFVASPISNEAGQADYASYWSSTTHNNLNNYGHAVYVAFGRSLGYMLEEWTDVHGAGSQRSDPKVGDATRFPAGRGPQADAVRIDNMVRCVTDSHTHFAAEPAATARDAVSFVQPTGSRSVSNSRDQRGPRGHRGDADPFTRMDQNGDGMLSRDEVRGPLADDFDSIDQDADGYISASELPPRPPARMRAGRAPTRRMGSGRP